MIFDLGINHHTSNFRGIRPKKEFPSETCSHGNSFCFADNDRRPASGGEATNRAARSIVLVMPHPVRPRARIHAPGLREGAVDSEALAPFQGPKLLDADVADRHITEEPVQEAVMTVHADAVHLVDIRCVPRTACNGRRLIGIPGPEIDPPGAGEQRDLPRARPRRVNPRNAEMKEGCDNCSQPSRVIPFAKTQVVLRRSRQPATLRPMAPRSIAPGTGTTAAMPSISGQITGVRHSLFTF